MTDEDDLESRFFEFWNVEKLKALKKLSDEEGLIGDKLQSVINNYLYTGRTPLRDDLIETMKTRPALKGRKLRANIYKLRKKRGVVNRQIVFDKQNRMYV